MQQVAAAPELADCPAVDSDVTIRQWLVLTYGTWLKVPAVIERDTDCHPTSLLRTCIRCLADRSPLPEGWEKRT